MEDGKTCSSCKEWKPREAFSKRREGKGMRSECKACHSLRRAERKSYARAYRLRTLYSLTVERYDKMLEQQAYGCAICGRMDQKLFVDHDHACCPGEKSCGECIRGLICHKCNVGIGMFNDNLTHIEAAYEYVKLGGWLR